MLRRPLRSCSAWIAFAAAALLATGGASLATATPASASTSVMVNCSTGGNLQSAIDNAGSSGNTIYVSGTCYGTFIIAQGTPLTIVGPATLDGRFTAGLPVVRVLNEVTLENLTIEGGNNYYGGGIFNSGTLTIDNSSVTHNTATDNGGGIANQGTLTLDNSSVKDNTVLATAGGSGGGIFNQPFPAIPGGPGGTLTLDNSSVTHNKANLGGGILNAILPDGNPDFGTVTLDNSSVTDNTAALGGGIYGYGGGTVTLDNSSVKDNTATYDGGGILNSFGTLTLNSSSVTDNTADTGGGIYNLNGGSYTLNDSVVKNNTPDNIYPPPPT